MGLYENVKKAANAKGYSINKLEKELGLPRSYILKFKSITPSAEKLKTIADFLDVSTEYLLTGEDQEGYYYNEETAKAAQEMFDNPELRALYDVARDMDPDELKAVYDMILTLKRKETDTDDAGY